MTETKQEQISWRKALLLALGAVACFHVAYTPAHSGFALAIVGYVACVIHLARLRTTRRSFYTGLAVGFACYAPQLAFFWNIFNAAAIALWLVLAVWLALFVALAHLALVRFGPTRAALLIPFLWTGLEYARSELYYLKFSWLNVGYAFAEWPFIPVGMFGMYGIGFAIFNIVLVLPMVWRMFGPMNLFKLTVIVFILWALAMLMCPVAKLKNPPPNLMLAGTQLEFPTEKDILKSLDEVIAQHLAKVQAGEFQRRTNLDLIVLPEYTLDGEPTQELKDWCRANQKFLIVGGKEFLSGTNDAAGVQGFSGKDYYNTAFVISTNGEVVFKQVKSVPIQFFKDGQPAPEQKVWESPWGRIGICICYDLSYTRVTDELVRQGAQMLIVPTMDVADWGQHQHELHARVAPVRAAEYGIPIFRVASSGISQGVNWRGIVQSKAPFPGEGEIIFFGARLSPVIKGSLPLDRYLAPVCVVVTVGFVGWLAVQQVIERKRRKV